MICLKSRDPIGAPRPKAKPAAPYAIDRRTDPNKPPGLGRRTKEGDSAPLCARWISLLDGSLTVVAGNLIPGLSASNWGCESAKGILVMHPTSGVPGKGSAPQRNNAALREGTLEQQPVAMEGVEGRQLQRRLFPDASVDDLTCARGNGSRGCELDF